MKEAVLYRKRADKQVICEVCPHHCTVKPNKRGLCMVRKNIDGTFYALNYGKTIALQIDPIEKKPLKRFLPGSLSYSLSTQGCNMRCQWCQNAHIAFAPQAEHEVEGRKINPKMHVSNALNYGCKSIAYTYVEPTVFLEYALDIMKQAHQRGLKNVWVSNGFATEKTWEMIMPFLDAINVDLKVANERDYKRYCQGGYQAVLNSLERLNQSTVHLEVTVCLVPNINDQTPQLTKMFKDLLSVVDANTPLHLTRFFPVPQYHHPTPTPIKTMEEAKALALEIGFNDVILGNL